MPVMQETQEMRVQSQGQEDPSEKEMASHSSILAWSVLANTGCHMHLSLVQFSSVTQSCPTLCDPMSCSMPGLPVHHQLLELAQIYIR